MPHTARRQLDTSTGSPLGRDQAKNHTPVKGQEEEGLSLATNKENT